ncbi:STS14 protein-like [Gastrolobium bilobum]|uniref:STS14 protein-like n=1 Tax=Gastrolobium bilobum TaxID=150636 RepID=UPI002AB12B08|nr:STS14 protein-like [Gastrolobium bilobum]
MGVCASSHSPTTKKTTTTTTRASSKKGDGVRALESFRRPSAIMVIDVDGGIKEYKKPIQARLVVSENPTCFLCNSESMYIGTCMPRVPDEEELLPGRIYFLVPLSHSDNPLSLPLLCDLAVKASSALARPNGTTNRASVQRRQMEMFNHSLFSLAVLAIFLVLAHETRPATAQEPAPPSPLPAAAREFLEAHNQARAAVGVEPLNWSEKLANATSLLVRYQRNKMGCQFANLTTSKYGGNQLMASTVAVTPRVAVEEWVKEKDFYIHGNNSCVSNHECGVYTQVVWRKSTELGCGQATCVKEKASLIICFYDPPGNVIGESPY